MTKTFCDRCGKEGSVVALNLSTPGLTERQIEACEHCISAVKEAMDPIPQPTRRTG